MYHLNHYVIDWDKVKTVDDMKRVLAVLRIAFEPDCPHLELIQDLVKLQGKDEPFPMPVMSQEAEPSGG